MVYITATEMTLGVQVLGTVWVYIPPGDDLGHFISKPSLHVTEPFSYICLASV